MRYPFLAVLVLTGTALCNSAAHAQEAFVPDPEFDQILALDIADLTVTSASRRKQTLSNVAAAIYVITQEDIRRMGVTSIPEALRAVPGLQVAQVNSSQWAVSARGFNGVYANKLLVMMDGRTIYTPIFSGTYWDDQDTLLTDVDRIEVIRGPGASVWGANAVNGVINIITKKAKDTQGNYAELLAGTEEYNRVAGRHGGKIGDDTFYRVYAKQFHRGKTDLIAGGENFDDWHRTRSGFRVDGTISPTDSYTVQGDAYIGKQGAITSVASLASPPAVTEYAENDSYGANILGRWHHAASDDSQTELQMYVDHYTRDERIGRQSITTADIDFQHQLALNDRNNFVWGLGMRHTQEQLEGSYTISLAEESKARDVFSAFLQNEFALVPERLFLTLGSKFEHNDFTGFEMQPTGRLSWLVDDRQTVWASVSRAVRVPSVLENEMDAIYNIIPGPVPTVFHAYGSASLQPEEVVAYEIGHRIQPLRQLSIDTALFVNDYDRLVTLESGGPGFFNAADGTFIVPAVVDDLGKGRTYGAEIASTWNVTDQWKLSASYSYLVLDLKTRSGTQFLEGAEESSPRHQFSIRSYLDITPRVRWDNSLYYVDAIRPGMRKVDDYLRLDTRLGWEAAPGVELSLVGRNLLEGKHPEYTSAYPSEIQRSVLGIISVRF